MSAGLQWQTLQLSLAGGIETREDVRAADPRQADIARDVQFDEIRGAQTRLPYGAPLTNIFGGGTITNARRIEANGDELVLFTDTQVYSWNVQLARWILRGTHLAVEVTETPTFTTIGDQIDGDRAELNGTVIVVWVEGSGNAYIAAMDKASGAVIHPPTAIGFPVTRPRVVATATRIMLTYVFAGAIAVRALDPANPAAGLASGVNAVPSGVSGPYDVVRIDTQDAIVGVCQRTPSTSYTVFTVTAGLTVNSSTKARVADGPVAVSTIPGGTQTTVVRANGTGVQADLITTATLVDGIVATTIGSGGPFAQITAAHRSVQNGGAFRCYGFWSSNESPSFPSDPVIRSNFIDSAGAVGTQVVPFVCNLGIASRAFSYAGSVYVWLGFGMNSDFQGNVAGTPVAQAQNAYLLYRDDAFLCAKAVYNSGGGLRPTTGHLAGVALTAGATTFSWAGTRKRVATLGNAGTSYAARAVEDITFTFDSNAARRVSRIGRTLYIAAGEILQYDGVQLTETGFHFYPFAFDMLKAGTGSVATGTYAYKLTARWVNAQGESERSTTATIGTATMTGGPAGFTMGQAIPLSASHKIQATNPIAIEVWRTTANPTADNPFFLATSNDPNNLTNPNKYIPNEPTSTFMPAVAWRDELADAGLSVREVNPENGTILEVLSPPAASIIFSTDTRVFLGGVAGDADSVWYSRQRQINEIASFNDALTIPIPPEGGVITALAFLNETLVVFREAAVYAVPGVGFDNAGQGQNFGPANRLSSDVGAISAESVALTPAGLIFKSRKGWYVLKRSWEAAYIGANAAEFDDDTVLAVHVVESQHHVRILTNARLILWDYISTGEGAPTGQWAEWTISDGLHATMWRGQYVYLSTTGPRVESATYTGVTYGMDIETSWIKLQDLQGAARVRWIEVLGEFRSPCFIRIRVARDYQYDGAGNVVFADDVAWPATPAVVGSALQVRHALTQGQAEAIKVRVSAVTVGAMGALATLTGLTPVVTTSGSAWDANWSALLPGTLGNTQTLSIAFEDGSPFTIDVREHFAWSIVRQRWTEDLNNVGVRVRCRTGSSPTVAQLETAIAAGAPTLIELDIPDLQPTKVINATGMAGLTCTGTFIGGTFVAPTGEACKLTGLGLEVGVKPGLFRRLPAAQKV